MQEVNNTQYFKVQKDQDIEVKDVVEQVYRALIEKGYNLSLIHISEPTRP